MINAVENICLSIPLVAIESVVQNVDSVLDISGTACNPLLLDNMFGLKLRKDFVQLFISDTYTKHGLTSSPI